MTREEKIRILEDALDGAYQDLDVIECMLSKDVHHLVLTIEHLEMLLREHQYMLNNPVVSNPVPEPEKQEAAAAPSEPVAPVEESTPGISKDEMRTKLAELGDKCSDNVIPGVMKSMGYDKLSQVPAARYAELLEKVTAAVEEAK